MDRFQLMIAAMAMTDHGWGPRDADARCRAFTYDEFDALADWGWHLPDLKGRLAACVKAVRSRLRPRDSSRLDATTLSHPVALSHS